METHTKLLTKEEFDLLETQIKDLERKVQERQRRLEILKQQTAEVPELEIFTLLDEAFYLFSEAIERIVLIFLLLIWGGLSLLKRKKS